MYLLTTSEGRLHKIPDYELNLGNRLYTGTGERERWSKQSNNSRHLLQLFILRRNEDYHEAKEWKRTTPAKIEAVVSLECENSLNTSEQKTSMNKLGKMHLRY